MADKRINALANTAPSTASDDFIAVDGTTNGTRKLSAFSPTFGGNATVGGTLTVTGDTSTFGINSSTNNSIKIITGVGTTASPRYGLLDFRNYNDLKSGAYLRVANREADTNAFLMNVAVRSNADVLTSIATFSDTQLAVLSTTASTTTSSGALVVSGGVGVAGAINAGDQIKSERTSGTDTASAVLGVLTTTGAGVTNSFGIDARVIVNNSSGTTTSATGLRALSRVSNVSTVTQAVAMLAQVDNPGGGTITTAYGLYVNPITAGGTNYAIYTGGGRINFQSLPTSSAGLAAGTIWNDGGTLKVA